MYVCIFGKSDIMVKKLDIFDDYNKNDKIQIVFDSGLDTAKGSSVREEHVFGIYTNEYNAKYGGYVYLDFKGWIDSNNVIVKPSSLVVTLRTTPGAYVKGGFSKVIFDETGFVTSRVKTDYFIWDPADFTLNLSSDTVFSKYWLTNKKIDADFFKKFNNTYGVKIEEFEDYVDDNISETGLDVHVSKSNGKLDVNYPGSHNLGGGGSGSLGIIDITKSDYIIGLENETLSDSFYSIIEKDVFKTDTPDRNIFISYQGIGGIFQTDNKVHVINRDNYLTVDKTSDNVHLETTAGFDFSMIMLNNNVCELDDYFVVFTRFTGGQAGYFLIDKDTDNISGIQFTGLTNPGNFSLLYCKVRDGDPSRAFDDRFNTLTNGSVVWGLPSSSYSNNGRFLCLVDIASGLAYDTPSSVSYYWPSGATVDGNGCLWVPYKAGSTSQPINIIRKYEPTSGLPYTDINLPTGCSFYGNNCNGYRIGDKLIYPGYDTSSVNTCFFIIDSTTDIITKVVVATNQYKAEGYSNILSSYYDKLKNRIYVAYFTSSAAIVQIGYLDVATETYIGSTLNLNGNTGFTPSMIKRLNENTMLFLNGTSSNNPMQYSLYNIKDDLTTIYIQTHNLSSPTSLYNLNELNNIMDSDDNYVYIKLYGNGNLIKVNTVNGDVDNVKLGPKPTYYSTYAYERVTVLGNDNVLISPAWHYKNDEVINCIDDKSLTEGRTYHVLDSSSSLVQVIDEDNNIIYSPFVKNRPYTEVLDNNLERLKAGDFCELIYVKNKEEVPYKP